MPLPAASCENPVPEYLQMACLWEVTAPKAGNVHPRAEFTDLNWQDFVLSAGILKDYYQSVPLPWNLRGAVSQTLLELARLTRQNVGKNTNLGILLLLVPLAAVPLQQSLATGIAPLLDELRASDTIRFYEAIRTMQPGGMNTSSEQDLASTPTLPVRAVMQFASDYDLIARQYVNNFADVFDFGLEKLSRWWEQSGQQPLTAVTGLHLDWLAHYPDSLIQRKLGLSTAKQAAEQAQKVLAAGWPRTKQAQRLFQEFDHWLRADGNRRNPGTSADLVAATLFAGFREGLIPCSPVAEDMNSG